MPFQKTKQMNWIFTTALWFSPILKWKSDCSLSKAVCVCFFKKLEPKKRGFRVIWQTQVNFHIRSLVLSKFEGLKSNCSLSKAVSEGKKSYIYSICNHPFCKQSYFKNHVVAVHTFSEHQTDELNFHYSSLVLFNSKLKIWLLTFKSCLCMFF